MPFFDKTRFWKEELANPTPNRMTIFKIILLFSLLNNISCSLDVTVTMFEEVTQEHLSTLPGIQCLIYTNQPGKPKWSCVHKFPFRTIFMIGVDDTNCTVCFLQGNHLETIPGQKSGVHWQARKGQLVCNYKINHI